MKGFCHMVNLNHMAHVALLASPGMGHLIPMLELGNQMATHHNLQVTVFVVAADQASPDLLNSSKAPNFHLHCLPPVDLSGILPPDAPVVTKIVVLIHESLPALRSAISEMRQPPAALVVDMFGTGAYSIADEFGMLRFVLDTTTAWFLAAIIYAGAIDEKTLDEHVVEHKPMKIPGCKPLRYEDTLEPLEDRDSPFLHGFKIVGPTLTSADGILVNSWQELEPATVPALADPGLLGRVARIPIYPVGPLVRRSGSDYLEPRVKDWLDRQPVESVIYVSFGSGGTLSLKQLTELAIGLEQSQQRFIWVVRPPIENDVSAAFFEAAKGSCLLHTPAIAAADVTYNFLPEGFLKRTSNVGLVIPMWAPQASILSHRAVGGFLSHCGWNSTLESIMNGVPMIAWPLFADQKMNATMLSQELGVAVRVSASSPESGRVVEREDVEKAVRSLIVDDKERRKRAKDLKWSGHKALAFGGSSYNSLSKVARECQVRLKAGYGA